MNAPGRSWGPMVTARSPRDRRLPGDRRRRRGGLTVGRDRRQCATDRLPLRGGRYRSTDTIDRGVDRRRRRVRPVAAWIPESRSRSWATRASHTCASRPTARCTRTSARRPRTSTAPATAAARYPEERRPTPSRTGPRSRRRDGEYAWHDHRSHLMVPTPPAGAQPGDEIFTDRVPIVVDGVAGRDPDREHLDASAVAMAGGARRGDRRDGDRRSVRRADPARAWGPVLAGVGGIAAVDRVDRLRVPPDRHRPAAGVVAAAGARRGIRHRRRGCSARRRVGRRQRAIAGLELAALGVRSPGRPEQGLVAHRRAVLARPGGDGRRVDGRSRRGRSRGRRPVQVDPSSPHPIS